MIKSSTPFGVELFACVVKLGFSGEEGRFVNRPYGS